MTAIQKHITEKDYEGALRKSKHLLARINDWKGLEKKEQFVCTCFSKVKVKSITLKG